MSDVALASRVWPELARRMGYTAERVQQDEIVAAVRAMSWTRIWRDQHAPVALAALDDASAVYAVAAALLHGHPGRLCRLGGADMQSGRRLVGLEDGAGRRDFVLDVDGEAIQVLVELPSSAATGDVA